MTTIGPTLPTSLYSSPINSGSGSTTSLSPSLSTPSDVQTQFDQNLLQAELGVSPTTDQNGGALSLAQNIVTTLLGNSSASESNPLYSLDSLWANSTLNAALLANSSAPTAASISAIQNLPNALDAQTNGSADTVNSLLATLAAAYGLSEQPSTTLSTTEQTSSGNQLNNGVNTFA